MSKKSRNSKSDIPDNSSAESPTAARSKWRWLTLGAFAILLGALYARISISDSLREPFTVTVGSGPSPRVGGPATGIGLDLLCIIPALLVLLRRAVDRRFTLRWNWSVGALFLLAILAAVSTIWSADKFAAAVGAGHFIAAAAALWAASQLVADWKKFRLLTAVCTGLLALSVVAALCYRWMDQAATLKYWEDNKAEILREHGWTPDSFAARQFAENLKHALFSGYVVSPNSMGALATLLLLIVLGCGIDRITRRRSPLEAETDVAERAVMIGVLALIAIGGIFVEGYSASKAAGATLILGVILLLILGRARQRLARLATRLYVIGVIVVILFIAAAIGHGLYHHNLGQASLTFRWQYWVGSMHLFAAHWHLGTGWNNFRAYYLQYRLPIASEEITDPHNFFIHFMTELGIAGGLLAVAWMLRIWWEMTRPATPPDAEAGAGFLLPPLPTAFEQMQKPLRFLPIVGAIGLILGCGCGIDWRQDSGYILTEILKHLLLFCAFVIGAAVAALRSFTRDETDGRSAPWVLYAVIVALGMFLVHNLVDFSFFESGPMLLFCILAGGVLGMRKPAAALATKAETAPGRRAVAFIGFAAAAVVWGLAAVNFWGKILTAEQWADQADAQVRSVDPKSPTAADEIRTAAGMLMQAHALIPYNADYDDRIGKLLGQLQAPDEAEQWFDEAIAANPMNEDFYLDRLSAEQQRKNPRLDLIRHDFEKAIALDPANLQHRRLYADFLREHGDPAAREQYRLVLQYNDQLEKENPRRLTDEDLRQIKVEIGETANNSPADKKGSP